MINGTALTENTLLLAVIFSPLIAAFAAYIIGRRSERARDIFAI